MGKLRISEEELVHKIEETRAILGTDDVSEEDYNRLAMEAAEQSRYYAAAVYYHLAESQALPDRDADRYKELTRDMLALASERGQGPPSARR